MAHSYMHHDSLVCVLCDTLEVGEKVLDVRAQLQWMPCYEPSVGDPHKKRERQKEGESV